MKVAIFDHLVNDGNAIGKCHLELLSRLADEHDFTVFAVDFDNPRPDRIRYVKVPALRYPLLGLMLSYHIIAPLLLWWYQIVLGERFDLVQGIGGNFLRADLAYGHFCHRVYLRDHVDARPKTPVRRAYSWIYDSIVSALEPWIYRRAKYIVTPSQGLARELHHNFDGARCEKMHIIANPVNVTHMMKPPAHDATPMRASLNLTPDDLVLVFVGAGHFERKGLPILLEAMQIVNDQRIKLIVVGGRKYMIDEYKRIAKTLGVFDQVRFVGFQSDIRPYLWASDIFAFPSAYEVFPLVSLEAAASGLPLLCTPLNGVEEFLQEGVNGWQVERNAQTFANKICYALTHRTELAQMGLNAASSVLDYSPAEFGNNWKDFYAKIEKRLSHQSTHIKTKDITGQITS